MKLASIQLQVPKDVIVASFDNTDIAKESTPSITTVGVSRTEAIDAAINLMQNRLEKPNSAPKITYLRSKIYEWESTNR